MEKALATGFPLRASLASRLRRIRLGGEGIRPQKQVASGREDNPFKKVAHATRSQLDKHPNESQIERHLK